MSCIKILKGIVLLFCSFALLSISFNVVAKKRCKALHDKLYHIQALQRQGYSLKKGQSLRAREDKARKKWWQCENSSYKSTKKVASNQHKRKKSQRSRSNTATSTKKHKHQRKAVFVASPFSRVKSIELSSSFTGVKQYAWLDFYKKPSQCHKPSSLAIFAFCSEDRLKQQAYFERSYRDKHTTVKPSK